MTKPINPTTCTHKDAYREKGRRGSTGDYICPDCKEVFSSKSELQAAQQLGQGFSSADAQRPLP